MKEKIEIIGYWNINSDINRYSGTLVCKDDEILLTLLDCEIDIKLPFVVHGISIIGVKYTLYDCFVSKSRTTTSGIGTIEISAFYCFIGENLTESSLLFESAFLKISSLNEWVDLSGFVDLINEGDELSVFYKNMEPISFFKDDNVEFLIYFQRTSPFMLLPKHNCTINQETLIQIKHKSKFSFDEYWKYVVAIKSFLTLAYFSEPHIQEIKLFQDENMIVLFYVGQNKGNFKDKRHRKNFLFTYDLIKNEFNLIFNKWKELNVLIEPVINVLQESFSNRNLIIENKFLNLMQAIETFHRRRRNNEKESKEIFNSRLEQIFDLCLPEHRDWLKERISYKNEPDLDYRLTNLFKEIDTSLIKYLFKNERDIILDSKYSRNYYTHYGKELEKKVLRGKELYYLTERLKIFLLILLLQETEIGKDKVNIIVKDASIFLFNNLIYEE